MELTFYYSTKFGGEENINTATSQPLTTRQPVSMRASNMVLVQVCFYTVNSNLGAIWCFDCALCNVEAIQARNINRR